MPASVEDPRLALVLGGARRVWWDLAEAERLLGREWPGYIIAVNDVGCVWTRELHHWASLHPEKFESPLGWRNPNGSGPHGWKALREINGHPGGFQFWSHYARRPNAPTDRKVIKDWGGGSSGLLAVAVGYQLGCARIVLAGVPMNKQPHFDESVIHMRGRAWASVESHRRAWVRRLPRLRERTRSMSGWTQAHLGAPNLDWLLLRS